MLVVDRRPQFLSRPAHRALGFLTIWLQIKHEAGQKCSLFGVSAMAVTLPLSTRWHRACDPRESKAPAVISFVPYPRKSHFSHLLLITHISSIQCRRGLTKVCILGSLNLLEAGYHYDLQLFSNWCILFPQISHRPWLAFLCFKSLLKCHFFKETRQTTALSPNFKIP